MAPTPVPAPSTRIFTAAPVPEIAGIAQQGQTLTARADEWEPAAVELTYQWERDGIVIPGATQAIYVPGPDAVGSELTVSLTGTRPGYGLLTRTSEPTPAVIADTQVLPGDPDVYTAPSGEALVPEAAEETLAPEPVTTVEQTPTSKKSASAEVPGPFPGEATATLPAMKEIAPANSAFAQSTHDAQFLALSQIHGLGNPLGPVRCGLTGGGCQQDFVGASIYHTPNGKYLVVSNPIRAVYWAGAGHGGLLGYPTSEQRCGLTGGACVQEFTGGDIFITPATGTHAVRGAFRTHWEQSGGETGGLGYPVSGAFCGLVGGGCQQDFTGGTAYLTPSGAVHLVTGAFRGLYWTRAGQGGALGYPVTGQRCGLAGGGCIQDFAGGSIYGEPGGGTYAVQGALRNAYWNAGGHFSALGYPKANHSCGLIGGGCQQDFESGSLYLTPSGAVYPVNGSFRTAYWGKAGQGGALGYPVTEQRCGLTGGGCQQDFTGGTLYSNAVGGVFSVQGAIRISYWNSGGHGGGLGYPTGDHVCGLIGSGCQQNFERGTVSLTGSSPAVASTNPFSSKWLELGGSFGYLGYPTNVPECGLSNGGCKQSFQRGAVVSGPNSGVHGVGGPIAALWAAQRAQEGRYGYPTAAQSCSGGYCSQAFQGGTISTAPAGPTPPSAPASSNYRGQGSAVIAISKPGGANLAAVAGLTHNGRSNFIIYGLDSALKRDDLLVNEIGQYGGTVLFDDENWGNTDTVYLEIIADGAWTVSISAVESVPRFDGSFEVLGKGDAVLYYTGGNRVATLLDNGTSNFVMWSHRRDTSDLIINEIGPYVGSHVITGPGLYEISSNGTWSILPH